MDVEASPLDRPALAAAHAEGQETAVPQAKEEKEMIENAGDNGDGKKQPHVCGTCRHWRLFLVNPQIHQALGVCGCQDGENAPFGVATAGWAKCDDWQEKPEVNIIKAPAGAINRLRKN